MRVEPSGPCPCPLAIFGEAPGFEEQQQGRGFVGKSGQQLWADMKRHTGLMRDDFYVSNVIKDGLPKNRQPKPEEIAAALPEFLDELEQVQPRVVITAGGTATRAMLGDVKMSDVHGIPHIAEVAGRFYTVMPIYHPAAGLHNKGYLSSFAYDLKQLKRLLSDDLLPWHAGAPARTEWLLAAPTANVGAFSQAKVVALDTEGWPSKPWGLSFSFDGRVGYVIPAGQHDGSSRWCELMNWFINWLRGKTIVMHGGLWDITVLRAMGIDISEYHDTQVLAYHDMMRTGSGVLEAESQNLGTLGYRECGTVLGELHALPGVDLASQVIPYTDEVMHYAGMDPAVTWRLFQIYKKRGLTDTEAYKIDMGQVPLVEEMIANGIPFDVDATLQYYTEVLDKFAMAVEDLRHRAARFGNRDFNPGSHVQVRELLTRKIGLRIRKRTKGGLASTNEKALADHADEPFVAKLQVFRELQKLKGTYIVPLLEELQ